MRFISFSKRNFKEIIRDPLSLVFCLGLPLALLIIFQQIKVPNEAFNIENFTAGTIVFSLAFITMFTAVLVAKDRSTSLLTRLFISPMSALEYISGYTLSVLPVVIIQCILFFGAAVIMGLDFSVRIILCSIISVLMSIMFIMLGIFIGCITNEKSSSGLSSIIVQLVAFTSGMYFPCELLGKGFSTVCKILPFLHSTDILKNIINGTSAGFFADIMIYFAYTIIFTFFTVIIFNYKMKNQ